MCGILPITLRAPILHCKHEELQSKYTKNIIHFHLKTTCDIFAGVAK